MTNVSSSNNNNTCCGPSKHCCTCTYYPPSKADECRCGCGYYNGVFQILLSQFLFFCGFWFALAVLGDCSFVEVSPPLLVRQDGVMASRIGLLSYQDETDGRCYFWTDQIVANNTALWGDQQLDYYVRSVLGRAWYPTIALGITTVIVSFLGFLYVASYCCSSQVRGVRMFTGFFVAIVIVTCQGLTFLILDSDWCRDNQCETSRSAGFAYAACVAFFISGMAFCFMSNYPGQAALAKMQEERHAMVGDEEAGFPATSPTAKDEEDLQDRRSEEEPHSSGGDDDYITDHGIEKTLTEQSNHESSSPQEETVQEDPEAVHVTAQLVSDPETKENGNMVTTEMRSHPDYSTTLNPPKPPSDC
jgi:hypothetical protein